MSSGYWRRGGGGESVFSEGCKKKRFNFLNVFLRRLITSTCHDWAHSLRLECAKIAADCDIKNSGLMLL